MTESEPKNHVDTIIKMANVNSELLIKSSDHTTTMNQAMVKSEDMKLQLLGLLKSHNDTINALKDENKALLDTNYKLESNKRDLETQLDELISKKRRIVCFDDKDLWKVDDTPEYKTNKIRSMANGDHLVEALTKKAFDAILSYLELTPPEVDIVTKLTTDNATRWREARKCIRRRFGMGE